MTTATAAPFTPLAPRLEALAQVLAASLNTRKVNALQVGDTVTAMGATTFDSPLTVVEVVRYKGAAVIVKFSAPHLGASRLAFWPTNAADVRTVTIVAR